MDWERILLVFTDILLPLAAGYLLKIHNLMPQKACDWLIRFNVVVMVTVLTLMSFWVLPLSAQLLWLPLIGVLITAVPGVIGARCFAGQFDNELDRGAYCALLSCTGKKALPMCSWWPRPKISSWWRRRFPWQNTITKSIMRRNGRPNCS